MCPQTGSALKVCMVTTAFPRWQNDSRQHSMLYTAQALQSHGVGVRVIALHAPRSKTREAFESVEVIRVRYMLPERFEILQDEGGGLPSAWRKHRAGFTSIHLARLRKAASMSRRL